MAKRKQLLCTYCKGTESFVNNKGFTRWGVRCKLTSGYPIRNYDTEGQAQMSIDEWCTGDGRRACRPYLLHEVKHHHNFSGDLLREFDAMEAATMAKQTYHCACGKTFTKSSSAQDTGYRMDDYDEAHECYGCPFVEPVKDWNTGTDKSHECRASVEKVNYTTTGRMALDSDCSAHVYTLELTWLDFFINFYLDTPGCGRKIENRDPVALEEAFRLTGLSKGRRSYSFEFEKNKLGRAARKIVHDEFFNKDGEAYQLGCGPSDPDVRVLQMIEYAKREAREDVIPMDNEIFGVEELATIASADPQRNITEVTAEIRYYKAQTVQNIIEIGKRLIEAKELLEHGQWGEWLRNTVEFSHQTANNFMVIAEQYSNSQALGNLNYTKLVTLLTLPVDDRDDFIEATHVVDGEEKTVDEMTTRELQRVIKERDEVKQQLAAAQRTADEHRVQADMRRDMEQAATHKLHVTESKLVRLKDENHLQRLDIARLENQPIDVAVQPPSAAEMESMRTVIRAEVINSIALPDTYLARKGVEEATDIFSESVSGAVANGLIIAMRLDARSAAKLMEVYISALVECTQQLRSRLNIMREVDRGVKDGDGDVDW